MEARNEANPFSNGEAALTVRPQQEASLISVEQEKAIAEVQASLIIAKKFPRDPIRAADKIINACTRLSLAEAALYESSRGGTDITGPSIRLAEVVAQNWGNLVCGVTEVSRRSGESDCLAYAWDLETNFRDEKKFTVKHIRDTKKGSYKVEAERDIYELVANMGARRKRACILAVIPGDVMESAVNQVNLTLKSKAEITPDRIKNLLAKFAEYAITKEQIETRIQKHLDAMSPAQLIGLGKIYNSLKDGMSSPSDWFEGVVVPQSEAPKEKEKVETLKDKLRGRPPKKAKEKEEPPATPPPPPPPPAKEPEKEKADPGVVDFGDGEQQTEDAGQQEEEAQQEVEPAKPTFLTECQNYFETLSNTNWAIIARWFGVANKKPEEIDKDLPAEAKVKFLDQCKKGLAKQNS